jgi:hypothetical protein
MPKFTISIETDDADQFTTFLKLLDGRGPSDPTDKGPSASTVGDRFPDDGDSGNEIANERLDEATKVAKRGRPSKTKPAVSPPPADAGAMSPTKAAFQASVDATDAATNAYLPSLENLVHAVTTAVRLAQKGEGDDKILDLLPDFKKKTGLDFVMNATDTHRAALFELVKAAGLQLV